MSDGRIRVAAVIDTAIISGPGRQLAAVVPPLHGQGIDIRILVFQNPDQEKTAYRTFLESAGLDHAVIPFRGRLDFSMLGALRDRLHDWSPHLVQTHNYRPTVLVSLLRRRGGVPGLGARRPRSVPWPWVGFYHGTTHEDLKVRFYHWLDRRLLRTSHQIVVMSREQEEVYFGDVGDKVRQVYNAVLPLPKPAPATDSLSLVQEAPNPRLGFVGRLSQEKGIDVALRTLRCLHDMGQGATLIVAGDGPERETAEGLAKTLQIQDSVRFLGLVNPIEPLYPLLDLLLISSRSEGLPNVLFEAFRAHVPVVSTTVGAVPEVLGGSRAGRMAPPEEPEMLAREVKAALEEADTEEVRTARAQVLERFSLDQRVGAHVELYHQMLDLAAS